MKKIIAALLAVVMIMTVAFALHPVLQKNIPIKRLPFLLLTKTVKPLQMSRARL